MFPKEIQGTIVTLKQLAQDHFVAYHKMFSPKVRKAIGLPEKTSFEETKAFLTSKLKELQKNEIAYYCIFNNANKRLIGAIEIRKPDYANGQLGAWLNENYWGEGKYQETLDLLLKTYFNVKNIEKINAQIETKNIRSIKAHQKYGFKINKKIKKNGKILYEMIIQKSNLPLKFVSDVIKPNKLVRNKIPQILEKRNIETKTYICKNKEYYTRLKEKLKEETAEFLHDNTIEELADILEVVYTIVKHKGITKKELEKIRVEKKKKNGGFDKQIVLLEVSIKKEK